MAISAVYITFPSKKEAEAVCFVLVKKRLIACANIFPVKSIYSWEEKVVRQKEFAALCKTKPALVSSVEKEVKKRHSYKVPCICSLKEKANEDYEKWVREVTK